MWPSPTRHGGCSTRCPLASPQITILRNGTTLQTRHTATVDLEVDRDGVYRVEARIGGRLWLLSNPIHLRRPGDVLTPLRRGV